jgi:hypothetical protein
VEDSNLLKAVTAQNPVLNLFPETPVSHCFYRLAKLIENHLESITSPELHAYWQALAIQKETALPKPSYFENYQQASQQFIASIKQSEISRAQAIQIVKPLIEAYLNKIHPSSEVLYSAIYHFLEKLGYPETEIKDLVFTLESIYEKTHGKPLRSINHSIAKILVDMQGSEKKMQLLLKTLEKSFARQFNKSLYDPIEMILAQISKEEMTEQQFATMMRQLKQAYKKRFHNEFQEDNNN